MTEAEWKEAQICLSCQKPECNNCLDPAVQRRKELTFEELEAKRAAGRDYYRRKKERENA